MPVKIHLRFVFFTAEKLRTHARVFLYVCRESERVWERMSEGERKRWIDWNPGKWMAEHRNNEPYLHFKAYSNKDNNGLGSQGKKELRMVYERDRENEWDRESLCGKARAEAKRTPGDCMQFVLWDRSMHIKRALNHTHEAWLMPPSPAACRAPMRRQIKLISTFCVVLVAALSSWGFNAALLNHFYCHWNVQKFCAVPCPLKEIAAKRTKAVAEIERMRRRLRRTRRMRNMNPNA